MRFKYRYLVVEANRGANKEKLTKEALTDAIRSSIAENFGEYGSGSLLPTYQGTFYAPKEAMESLRAITNIFPK